jgi:hypothetical protein
VARTPPADLTLTTLDGGSKTVREWTTNFPLASVVIDPYTSQSAWLLHTSARLLRFFTGADVRVNWIVTADPDDARAFLGPLATEFLTFADPDRVAVRALGLEKLPALVVILQDLSIAAAAEGWQPAEWRGVTDSLTKLTAWGRVVVPADGDPGPFEGSAAAG